MEKKRVINKGGLIHPFSDHFGNYFGPDRVWIKGLPIPGLSISRSFGDALAHSIGVISKPDFVTIEINENSKYILIGSNGIWEYMSTLDVSE